MEKYFYQGNNETDVYLFHEGNNNNLYKFLGSHIYSDDLGTYTRFLVWAPNAKHVNLVGDFNDWDNYSLPLQKLHDGEIWEICLRDVKIFDSYKYRIVTQDSEVLYKADPFAFHSELRPKTASKVYDIEGYKWNDKKWIKKREQTDRFHSPMSIYEINLSSWRKHGENYLSYIQLADELVDYLKEMNYTHVEFMPLMEHPFDGSWGYQLTGFFAATSRFGCPKDLMYLIDKLHQNDIGVIMDWVPAHFCRDDFGLRKFDGSNLFEKSDQYLADNDQWGTLNFDFSKKEVVNFLISSALFWFKYYHLDGLRVDAVAYMIYLNFAGKDIRNEDGSYENKEAIEFIKKLNQTIKQEFPSAFVIAEESTSWPNVTKSVEENGLGFDFKWNMGWMNDIIKYMKMDPIFRKDHHNLLTFSIMYAFNENYILPFSHDEVVHMKNSMIGKMPGTYDEKFDQIRLLYSFMFAHPGKKLLFMGNDIGQFDEWNEYKEVTWEVLEYEKHQKLKHFMKDLNKFYIDNDEFYDMDTSYSCFQWEDVNNANESLIIFERINSKNEKIICIFNFTPVKREKYPVGVDNYALYSVVLNSSMKKYGGNLPRNKPYYSKNVEHNDRKFSITVDIEPFSAMFIKLNKLRNINKK
ncbi:1,4-alpha-glucan branching protein GlgB [Finegoldia magna]|uniref:1,4-alpha-glucan branching protein GlgB n=1 Tax=Finegoldia magna TaxID=1260 RepID=UPI000B916626|nr:1,4-alpha-glucan branching protein GlgB [Finegoldia magna]MDU1011045.1 1,4-alpha-glucan branching protein GlgB [Finegoldia magna]MDU1086770.1 1,4-alpha-glucan branching protein GlgB [Finegoldia magna]OXZ38872.1 1,4-alpha-glucan branching enzyme [Finegoldia magna]